MSYFEAYTNTKEKVVEKIESVLKQSRFIRPLPASISKDKQFCQDLHEVFVQKTINAINENIGLVEESSKLESNLNQLNIVVNDEANQNENAWRPGNSALNNQAAHDHVSIVNAKLVVDQEILCHLQNDVDDLERQVTTLSYEIAANNAKIKEIL